MPDTHDATTYTVNWTGMDGMDITEQIHLYNAEQQTVLEIEAE